MGGACIRLEVVCFVPLLPTKALRLAVDVLFPVVQNAQDMKTALHLAAEAGSAVCVQFLVDNGSDIDVGDKVSM